MPTRSSKDHDFTTVARRVVEQAIGERLDGSPLEDPTNPAAVALGRLGGAKGGAARALAPRPTAALSKSPGRKIRPLTQILLRPRRIFIFVAKIAV